MLARPQADIGELGRTPVMVVSAGAKSILDIPRTLESLESHGVCVLAYGVDDFPAFFTRDSGALAPARVDTPAEAAAVAHSQRGLGLESGMLVGVPIPTEAEAEGSLVQAAIDQALGEADAAGLGGREVTPFLLKRINEISGGASLRANIALVLNNARVGADIAVALAEITRLRGGEHTTRLRGGADDDAPVPAPVPVVVVGGAVADLLAAPAAGTTLLLRTSNPGSLRVSAGGVGRNIAEALARLGCTPHLISAVGADGLGTMVLESLRHVEGGLGDGGITDGILQVDGQRTATYTALMDDHGDLCAAVADMSVHGAVTPEVLAASSAHLAAAPLCVCDANLSAEAIIALARLTKANGVPLWLEPTSVPKGAAAVSALYEAGLLGAVSYLSPNADEATAMAAALPEADGGDGIRRLGRWLRAKAAGDDETAVREAAVALVRAGVREVLVTRGARGVLWARGEADGEVFCEAHPARPVERITSTRGAGDCFVAGCAWRLAANLRAGRAPHGETSLRAAVCAGLRAAHLCVQGEDAVPPLLATEDVDLPQPGL